MNAIDQAISDCNDNSQRVCDASDPASQPMVF